MRLNRVESVKIEPTTDMQHKRLGIQPHPTVPPPPPVTQTWNQNFTQKPDFTHNTNHTSTQPMSSSMTYINSPSPKTQKPHPMNETSIHIPPLKSIKQNNPNLHQNQQTFSTAPKQEVVGSPVPQITYQPVGKVKKERKRDDGEQASRDGKRDRKNDRCTDPELKKLKCHQGGTYRFSMSKLHFRNRMLNNFHTSKISIKTILKIFDKLFYNSIKVKLFALIASINPKPTNIISELSIGGDM